MVEGGGEAGRRGAQGGAVALGLAKAQALVAAFLPALLFHRR